MKVRKCGCIRYEYGPPLQCEKHSRKEREAEEKLLRKVVRQAAVELGHVLGPFTEYNSDMAPGKWTSYCQGCGYIFIVYDEPPAAGDQIASWGLSKRCTRELPPVVETEDEDGDDELLSTDSAPPELQVLGG